MRTSSTLLTLLLCACVGSQPPRPSAPAVVAAPVVAISAVGEEIVVHTNARRRAAGLTELRRVTKLMQAAQLHAEQMAAMQRMSHDLPGARFPGPVDRLAAVEYLWSTFAENVAEGYANSADAIAGWMASRGHRANIVATSFTEMGAGAATGKNGRIYYVQVFAAPR